MPKALLLKFSRFLLNISHFEAVVLWTGPLLSSTFICFFVISYRCFSFWRILVFISSITFVFLFIYYICFYFISLPYFSLFSICLYYAFWANISFTLFIFYTNLFLILLFFYFAVLNYFSLSLYSFLFSSSSNFFIFTFY